MSIFGAINSLNFQKVYDFKRTTKWHFNVKNRTKYKNKSSSVKQLSNYVEKGKLH